MACTNHKLPSYLFNVHCILCSFTRYDVVITTYNIVGIEGASCSPDEEVCNGYYLLDPIYSGTSLVLIRISLMLIS